VVVGLVSPFLWGAILTAIVFWSSDRLLGVPALLAALEAPIILFGFRFAPLSLVLCVFLFFAFRSLNRLLTAALDQIYGARTEQSVLPSLKTLLFYGFTISYAMIVMRIFGIGLLNIAIVAGGLSVGVGFGLQHLVNNFLSGLIILFGRTIHHGDIIELDGKPVRVEKINIRETLVRSRQNALITIPNTEIINHKLINWSRGNRRLRIEMAVGVAYGSDIGLASRILLETAHAHPKVLGSPAADVLLSGFGSSSLDLVLRVWIENMADDTTVLSALRVEAERRFREAGIQIPFPQLDLHMIQP
jgi:small-conductance mechanosensitive channel